MRDFTRRTCRLFAAALALAGLLVTGPAEAQSVDQLTDIRVGVSSPAALTDDGAFVYAGSSIDPDAGNPLHKHQVYRFDTATGAATRITDLFRGVVPVAIELEVTSLLGVSDDGQRLAFVAHCDPLGLNHDVSAELFVMNSDGSGLAQLTSDPLPNSGSVLRIAFAGNGNRIAFVSNSDLTGGNPLTAENVFVIDYLGTSLTQITDLPPGHVSGITIADSGNRIAFSFNGNLDADGDGTGDNEDGSYEIYTVREDGSQLAQLTDANGFDSIAPAISGDGAKIVFQSNADLADHNAKNNDEIFVANWDGSALKQITTTKVGGQGLPFSAAPSITDTDPDGSGHWVYFFSNHSQGGINFDGNAEIMRTRTTGAVLEVITDTSFSDGSFVPVVAGDGSKVVFYSLDDIDGSANGTGNADGSPDLFVTDSDGANPLQLTAGTLGFIRDVDITPDAGIIAFSSDADLLGFDPDRGGEIYTMSGSGTGLSQVSNMFAGEAYSPSICEGGGMIAFISDDDYDGSNVDNSEELYLVNGDGSGVRRITRGPAGKRVANVRIVRDCSAVFYDSNSNETSMNQDGGREIWSAATDTTATLTQLTDNGFQEASSERPRVDDSGAWVVFQSTADLDGDGSASETWQVWRMSSDGANLQQIAAFPGFDAKEPEISGDGRLVAYSSNADPLGSNPEHNFELFVHDTVALMTTQLTTTSSGASGDPDFSNDGSWIAFSTNSDLFESDPDAPSHNARVELATGRIERIGALPGGPVTRSVSSHDGGVSVFVAGGNPTLENFDFSPEIFIVDHTEGPLDGIHVSGPAPTVLAVPAWVSGPMRFDFIRGDPDLLQLGGPDEVDLGAVVCVEADSYDLDTVGHEDASDPAPGRGFFYLWRGDRGANAAAGSYGASSAGAERFPSSGDCGN